MSEQPSQQPPSNRKKSPQQETTGLTLPTPSKIGEAEIRALVRYLADEVSLRFELADPPPGRIDIHCHLALCAGGEEPLVVTDVIRLHDVLTGRGAVEAVADLDAGLRRVLRPLQNRVLEHLDRLEAALPEEPLFGSNPYENE